MTFTLYSTTRPSGFPSTPNEFLINLFYYFTHSYPPLHSLSSILPISEMRSFLKHTHLCALYFQIASEQHTLNLWTAHTATSFPPTKPLPFFTFPLFSLMNSENSTEETGYHFWVFVVKRHQDPYSQENSSRRGTSVAPYRIYAKLNHYICQLRPILRLLSCTAFCSPFLFTAATSFHAHLANSIDSFLLLLTLREDRCLCVIRTRCYSNKELWREM